MTAAPPAFVPSFRPPAPKPHPAPLGTLAFLRTLTHNPVEAWTEAHFTEAFVPMSANVLGERIVVNDPDAIRHILVDNEANFTRDGLQLRVLHRTIGRGIFSAEGPAWRSQRKAVAPLFTPRAAAAFLPAMAAAADAAVERLAAKAGGTAIDMAAEASFLALDVLARTLFRDGFGVPLETLGRDSGALVEGAGSVSILDVVHAPEWLPGLRMLRTWPARRRLARMVDTMLASRRAALARGEGPGEDAADILSVLLSAAGRDEGDRSGLSEQELKDNVITFVGAGHETTGNALAWAIYLLSQADDVRVAVEAEVDAVLGDGPMEAEALDRLTLVRAVVEETLRLYPTAPFLSREARADDVVAGRPVKAGTAVLIVPWLIHRHRKLWTDPEVFDPGRFLPGRRETIPRYAWLPFGAGPRVCVGAAFAMQEAVLVLAALIRAFRFALAPGHRVEPLQRITLRPAGGMPMIIERRR